MMRRLIFEAQEKGNVELINEYCSPDLINHTVIQGMPTGREGILVTLKHLFSAFKDIKMEIIHCIAQDKYCCDKQGASRPAGARLWQLQSVWEVGGTAHHGLCHCGKWSYHGALGEVWSDEAA
jgi:hypothetical protein